MSYKPLPPNLTIKSSPIEGLGLFAKQTIPSKELYLGVTHLFIKEYNQLERTPLGGFINHSKKPNCEIRQVLDYDNLEVHELVTLRSIKKGEELFVNYDNALIRHTKDEYKEVNWKN